MSRHTCTIDWSRGQQRFTDLQYARGHTWTFDGGAQVAASSSPHTVPLPWSDPAAVDPEEAFVASLASCHMLWFLSVAASRGLVVDSYRDQAEGVLEPTPDGGPAMTRVTLRPHVAFSGNRLPDAADVDRLHHDAHAQCFIARSVRSEVCIQGTWEVAGAAG